MAAETGERRSRGVRVRRWRAPILIALGVALAGIVAAASMERAVLRAADGRIRTVVEAPDAPVAIVFGAGLRASGEASTVLAGRLETARRLYAAGKAQRLLLSGDNRTERYNEPDAMRDWLMARGVPASAIACDYAGRRTLDTCQRARRIWGVERAILVTHRYHLPRALYLARDAGIQAVGVPAAYGDTRRAAVRESFARVAAWLDVNLWDTEPAVWGPPEAWNDGDGEGGSHSATPGDGFAP